MSKQNLSRANYALEEWARWVLTNNGYPSTSVIEKIGTPSERRSGTSLPHGVELPNSEVANVIYVFHKMIEAGDRSAENCQILRAVILMRKDNESIKAFCRRLGNSMCSKARNITPQKYYSAVKEFTARLDML